MSGFCISCKNANKWVGLVKQDPITSIDNGVYIHVHILYMFHSREVHVMGEWNNNHQKVHSCAYIEILPR